MAKPRKRGGRKTSARSASKASNNDSLASHASTPSPSTVESSQDQDTDTATPSETNAADDAAENESAQSAGGCLVRLYWMVVGYLIAVICGVSIINHHGSFSMVDVVYWLAVAGIIAARYLDVVRFGGTRTDGKPATLADWKRHAAINVVLAIVGWAVIHFVRING